MRWGDDLRAQLEELAADYVKRLAQLRQLQVQAGRVTAVARSRDRLISVTPGPQGQLLGVDLDPAVYERLSPQWKVQPAGRAPGGDAAGMVPPGLSLLDGGVAGGR